MKKNITLLMIGGSILLLSLYIGRAKEEYAVYTMGKQTEQSVVVIDAGHGGIELESGVGAGLHGIVGAEGAHGTLLQAGSAQLLTGNGGILAALGAHLEHLKLLAFAADLTAADGAHLVGIVHVIQFAAGALDQPHRNSSNSCICCHSMRHAPHGHSARHKYSHYSLILYTKLRFLQALAYRKTVFL